NSAEIVQLHGALVVVETVQRIDHRAADGATGVVDQDVDPAVVVQYLAAQAIAVVEIGDVGAVGHGLTTVITDFGGQIFQRLNGAGGEQDGGASFGQLVG